MKATFTDGTIFEGTPEEFNAIRASSGVAQNGHKPPQKPIDGNPLVWDETNARSFWDSLDPRHKGGQQKKLLQFLIKHGGRAAYEEVKKHLEIESGQELAGVLANLSRNARRETGNRKALVVDWMSDGKGGCYYIPDGVLQLLKRIG